MPAIKNIPCDEVPPSNENPPLYEDVPLNEDTTLYEDVPLNEDTHPTYGIKFMGVSDNCKSEELEKMLGNKLFYIPTKDAEKAYDSPSPPKQSFFTKWENQWREDLGHPVATDSEEFDSEELDTSSGISWISAVVFGIFLLFIFEVIRLWLTT